MIQGSSSPRVVSLFCGLGGLDLGFEWAGFRVVWANDIEPHAVASYEQNHGLEPVLGDIHRLDIADLPSADVVIGGPPCQSFSLVGQRKVDDPRGMLVFRFLDVVAGLEPTAFVMENVPGMAASKINGLPLPDILTEKFRSLGYQTVKLKLAAIDYLTPQKRERIMIIGSRARLPQKPDRIRFASECYGLDADSFDISSRAAIGDLGPCTEPGGLAGYRNDLTPSEFSRIMRGELSDSVTHHECPRMSETDKKLVKAIPPGGNYRDIPDSISTQRIMKFKKSGGRTTTYGRLHPDRPAYTINTYFRRPNVGCHFHYSEPRLITAREAMRFQSIPDRFVLSKTSQDKRNALVGNAVPPLMAQAVAWSLLPCL